MRIWSLHPKYLDAAGLVALWRETLLAKHVLEGKTKGYKNHPQLDRFKICNSPLNAINLYLGAVYEEAMKRDYDFNKSKFAIVKKPIKLTVKDGQLEYEFEHLLKKLNKRDPQRYIKLKTLESIEPHPLFKVISGEIEKWEIVK